MYNNGNALWSCCWYVVCIRHSLIYTAQAWKKSDESAWKHSQKCLFDYVLLSCFNRWCHHLKKKKCSFLKARGSKVREQRHTCCGCAGDLQPRLLSSRLVFQSCISAQKQMEHRSDGARSVQVYLFKCLLSFYCWGIVAVAECVHVVDWSFQEKTCAQIMWPCTIWKSACAICTKKKSLKLMPTLTFSLDLIRPFVSHCHLGTAVKADESRDLSDLVQWEKKHCLVSPDLMTWPHHRPSSISGRACVPRVSGCGRRSPPHFLLCVFGGTIGVGPSAVFVFGGLLCFRTAAVLS